MSDLEIKKRQPPVPVMGVEYEWLPEDRICQECGQLILEHQIVVRRNARGTTFKDVLPAKNGICLNCAADRLSTRSIEEYEKVLSLIENYQTLSEKQEITEQEKKHMRFLEDYIDGLQQFVDELSSFVEYTEKEGVDYFEVPEDNNDVNSQV